MSLGRSYEFIVVDNHPERLAEGLVTSMAATGLPLTYLADDRRNISIVRNKGIAAARGTYVAFIDDDEAPEPGWLEALFECLRSAQALMRPLGPSFHSLKGANRRTGTGRPGSTPSTSASQRTPQLKCSAVEGVRARAWAAAMRPFVSRPALTRRNPSAWPLGTPMARTPNCYSGWP